MGQVNSQYQITTNISKSLFHEPLFYEGSFNYFFLVYDELGDKILVHSSEHLVVVVQGLGDEEFYED